jgi:anion-transporting  ArsA/GET3 family ATPase
MFSKTTFALAFMVATASGALAATKHQSVDPRHNVYDVRGTYVGSDPDANVRFELRRDSGRPN